MGGAHGAGWVTGSVDDDTPPDAAPTDGGPSVEYLHLADLIRLAEDLFGAPAPIRDVGVLGAAVVRPSVRFAGREVYPDVFTRAAALMESLVRWQPLTRGNARYAWFVTAVFLEINGVSTSAPTGEAVAELVAAMRDGGIDGEVDVTGVAERLRSLVEG